MSNVLQAALFQATWFACVLGGAAGTSLWGMMGLATLCAFSWFAGLAAADLALAGAAGVVGFFLDTLWMRTGVLDYPGAAVAPVWIVMLWMAVGLSVNHSLSLFKSRPWLGGCLAAAAAPFSYLAGEAFGAVHVADFRLLAVVSAAWLAVFSFAFFCCGRPGQPTGGRIMSVLINLAETRAVPDALIRAGIRRLVGMRLTQEQDHDPRAREERTQRWLTALARSSIAVDTDAANQQHYEVPPEFFGLVLGRHLKYSAACWDDGARNLDQAETRMLELYLERADLRDGQRVLDLGCGWGSFTLWAAQRYPDSRFTAVSNSAGQRRFIQCEAKRRRLDNVEVITCDVNALELDGPFDRIISVEMLEHVRNYAVLFNRMSGWLSDDGKVFVHIFCHRNLLYPFQDDGDADWMARHFFTGGLMPAADTLLFFQDDLRIERRWSLSGTNYARTARAWLANLDGCRDEARRVLAGRDGAGDAARRLQRWRMFFMACEELFGYRDGTEWLVCHYLFSKRTAVS